MKLTELDKVFSKYIRLKSGGYCKRCKKHFDISRLAAAHMFGRLRHTTRWNEKNVYALCGSCHLYLDTNPVAKTSFLHDILSVKEIEELEILANKTIKDHPINKEELLSYYKKRLRRWNELEHHSD